MKIYVLLYSEWEYDGEAKTLENVIASLDREKLVEYKNELEIKSEEIRDRIEKIEEDRDAKLKPLWDELRPLLKGGRKTPKEIERKNELRKETGDIYTQCYNEKDAILNEFGVEYYIDDPDLAEFLIDELEVLE